MTITTEQLNQVAALLGTTDKNLIISVCIKTLMDSGMGFRAAYDSIFGEGAFIKMADIVHDTFNA